MQWTGEYERADNDLTVEVDEVLWSCCQLYVKYYVKRDALHSRNSWSAALVSFYSKEIRAAVILLPSM